MFTFVTRPSIEVNLSFSLCFLKGMFMVLNILLSDKIMYMQVKVLLSFFFILLRAWHSLGSLLTLQME